MSVSDPDPRPDDCPECDVDALGRHHAMCSRAIQLGLPRLAEGEEPIEPSPEPPEPPGEPAPTPDVPGPAPRRTRPQAPAEPVTLDSLCVACGEQHAGPDDRQVGMARVAASCEWKLCYPGVSDWVVIEALEKMLVEATETPAEVIRKGVVEVATSPD